MIDPVALSVLGFPVHWYGIAWAVSFLIIFYMPSHKVQAHPVLRKEWEDLAANMLLVILIGGRVGEVLIYDFNRFLETPWLLFMIWKGGMSFYGAIVAGAIYLYYWSRKHQLRFFEVSDAGLIHVPIALGIVRVANFINGELWGRITDQSWGFYFPKSGPLLRHPSQLYEAFFEGLILWVIMYVSSRYIKREGTLTAIFMIGYGAMRLFIELYYREPSYDLSNYISTGVLFSVIFLCSGLVPLFKRVH